MKKNEPPKQQAGKTRDEPPTAPQDKAPAPDAPDAQPLGAEQLAALRNSAEQCAELKNQLLRARAEFDNYRKAARKEREAVREAAVADFAHDLFFVLDDVGRALDHLDEHSQNSPLAQGVALLRDKLLKALADRNVRPIETSGALFDPACHEAVAAEPTDAVAPNTILDEVRRGYTMGDRVIRAAQVRVAVRPQPQQPPSEGQ